MFEIRPARIEDAESLASLHVKTWQEAYANIMPEEYLRGLSVEERVERHRNAIAQAKPNTVRFVATVDGTLVGFIAGGPERKGGYGYDAELYAVYVLKSYYRRGVGKALTRTLVDALVEKNFSSMVLWVLEQNPSRAFYEALGGELTPHTLDVDFGAPLKEVSYGWRSLKNLQASLSLK